MAVTAYKYAGTAASVDRDKKEPWSNPDYAKADDTSYAICPVTKNTYGDYLLLTNFSFSSSDIPDGATINGIEFIICRYAEYADYISDSSLYLYDDGAVGNNLASATKWPDSEAEATYGGATNMCGTSLTQSDIVASTFGVRLSAANSHTDIAIDAIVDYIKIRVYYTEGGGSPVFLPNIMKHNFIPPLIGGF
jgi:hypothetical protein